MKLIALVTLFVAAVFAQETDMKCTLCEKAAGLLKNETDNIQKIGDNICMKLNTTTKQLECKLAVKTVVSLINSEDPKALCEKVKLCNETELTEGELLTSLSMATVAWPLMIPELTLHDGETKPDVDLCALCKDAVGVVQDHTQQLLKYLDSLCAKLNNTIEKAACDEAVQVGVNVLNSQTAQQICTEVKLCSSVEEPKVKSIYQSCGSCQQMFKIARAHPEMVSEFDCTSLSGMANWHTCQFLKFKADYYLNNYAPDQACVNLGACAKGYISGVW